MRRWRSGLLRRSKLGALTLATAFVATSNPLVAHAQKPPAAQAPTEPPPALDPASVEALERLGQHLVTLQSFEITSVITFDYVLDNDQKIQIGGTVRHRVRWPDRLRVDLVTDVLDRVFQHDGDRQRDRPGAAALRGDPDVVGEGRLRR